MKLIWRMLLMKLYHLKCIINISRSSVQITETHVLDSSQFQKNLLLLIDDTKGNIWSCTSKELDIIQVIYNWYPGCWYHSQEKCLPTYKIGSQNYLSLRSDKSGNDGIPNKLFKPTVEQIFIKSAINWKYETLTRFRTITKTTTKYGVNPRNTHCW